MTAISGLLHKILVILYYFWIAEQPNDGTGHRLVEWATVGDELINYPFQNITCNTLLFFKIPVFLTTVIHNKGILSNTQFFVFFFLPILEWVISVYKLVRPPQWTAPSWINAFSDVPEVTTTCQVPTSIGQACCGELQRASLKVTKEVYSYRTFKVWLIELLSSTDTFSQFLAMACTQ